MSHQSPKPSFAQRSLAATALKVLTARADAVHENTSALERATVPGASYRSGRWLVRIDDATLAAAPPFCWCYDVLAIDLAISLNGECPDAIATTSAVADDLALSGPALNLYELLNTATNADGIDPTNLPGTYAPKPASGLVECWHQRLYDGTVVRMFAKSVTIDGECEPPE
jgi:hypothetical protein